MRLIRSKGVGVYFVTQNPLDGLDTVLAQLGKRVQHTRAFTPRDQKAVATAADVPCAPIRHSTRAGDHRTGGGRSTAISFLDEQGRPNIVERAMVVPPGCRIGPLTGEETSGGNPVVADLRPLRGKCWIANRRMKSCAACRQPRRRRPEPQPSAQTDYANAAADATTVAPAPHQTQPQQPQTAPPAQEPGMFDGFGGKLSDILFGSTGPRGGRQYARRDRRSCTQHGAASAAASGGRYCAACSADSRRQALSPSFRRPL